MKSKNRRELALMQVEKARKNIDLVFDLLYTDEELEEIERNKKIRQEKYEQRFNEYVQKQKEYERKLKELRD